MSLADGSFTMGGDPGVFGSAPPHGVELSAFDIAWRATTVADYAAFVQANGYQDDRWWDKEWPRSWTEPEEWPLQSHHKNRPVVGVSWFEAMAYCRWLTDRGGPSTSRILLPTEAQWEFAARGASSSPFPWGDESLGYDEQSQANYRWGDASPGEPSPVGAFARGCRRVGADFVADLAGNVWEWCLDAWRTPEDPSWNDDDRTDPCYDGVREAMRIIRGGSWYVRASVLRSSSRIRLYPGERCPDVGFRLCRISRDPTTSGGCQHGTRSSSGLG